MVGFLEAAKSEFDVILFDSPPVLGFTDAAILGNKLDSTLLVFEAGSTTLKMTAKVTAVLENVNAKIVGVVLNRVKGDGLGYRYYDSYYRG
ncbi:MAG: hypothetical protein IH899_11330 [Planctomycetes bacterium]|nr:hypothetical protein [Planctomycetota bacterium]